MTAIRSPKIIHYSHTHFDPLFYALLVVRRPISLL